MTYSVIFKLIWLFLIDENWGRLQNKSCGSFFECKYVLYKQHALRDTKGPTTQYCCFSAFSKFYLIVTLFYSGDLIHHIHSSPPSGTPR